MASKGSRTISLILALVMVLGLFPSMSPSASAEFQEFDSASLIYGAPTIIPYGVPTDDAVNGQASVASGIPTTGLVDGQADAPVLTELVPQHVHHFVYSAEGNTIVARCDAEDCPLENGEAKLILKTDDAAKTDSVYAGVSIQNDIPLPESAVLGPVVYYVLNEAELAETGAKPESFLTEENRLEIAPKRVGTYLAAVTLTVDGTDYTVWNIFEIYLPKAVFTVRPEPVEGLVYDGQPHALVTPGDAGGSTVLYAVLANDETEPTDGFDDTFPMAADAGLYVVWFRAAGDADHEDSDTDHVVVRIQKAPQAAPAAPEAEVITTESITLKASEGYEYSMDGEIWQSDNTFGGLTANTEYRFFQRITGDYNLEPSPAGEAAVFCTLEDAPVVEEEPEAVPVKLWLVCDPPETALTVLSSAEGSSPVSPEEDGSYLLLPGSWICSAAAEGYQPIENSELTISAENGDTQYMTLELQKLPPVISPAFEETAFVSGMAVRVSAPEGVFPEGSTLSVTPVPFQEQQFVDAAVGSERGGSKTVMVSYTFDIKVLGPDGNEVQPADAQKVKVSFTANAVAEQNLNTDVYHVSGEGASLSAERLDTVEDGTTVTAETSGFSYYTVEFTYDTLQYVLPGGQDVALSEILNAVGLSGEVTGVTCSRPDLFSADTRSGEWVVYSHQPFTSTEWMKVVINGLVYEIIVTDAGGDSGSSSTAGDIILYDGIYEVSTIVIDEINRPEFYLHAYYGKEKPDAYEWVLNNNGGPFSVTFREGEATGDGNFLVFGASGTSQQTKGTLNIKYYKNSGGVRTLLAERNVPVEIRKTAIPEVQVSPGDLTIDLTKTKTATVTYSCSGADGFDISLYAKGGFATYTLGSEKVENGVRSGSLTISATSAGIATLEFVALKNGETAPVAAKTIQVTVKDGTSPLPDTSEIRVFDGSTEIYEIVIDKNNRPSLDLTLSYDNKPDNYTWGLLAKGAFYCDFYKDENGKQLNTFKIWYAKTGNSETWLKINLKDGNNNIVATRTITVTIRDADLPEVYAAPDPVTLNLAGNKTAAVSYRYTGASYFLIELNTKTGSPTFRLGDGGTSSGAASITMKEVKESGSVTLTATGTGTGTAELTFKAMKDGQTAPLAVKTVQVEVINQTEQNKAIRLYDGSAEISEIVIDKNNRPSFPLTLVYDGKTDGDTWALTGAGSYGIEFYKDNSGKQLNSFKIWYQETGHTGTGLEIELKRGDKVIAKRTVNVSIKTGSASTVSVTPNPVAIDLAVGSEGSVEYSYSGATYFIIDLNVTTGSPLFQLDGSGSSSGAPSITMKAAKGSGKFNVTVTNHQTGTADLRFMAMKDGQTAPLAVKTVQVKVIDLTAATDAATMVADAANKATKETSSSGGGSNSVTPGKTTAPIVPTIPAPIGSGNKNEQINQIRKQQKKQNETFWGKNGSNGKESTLKRQVQQYRLSKKTYTDQYGKKQSLYVYDTGICNYNAYTTLLNRYIAYHYNDYSAPVTTESIMEQDNPNASITHYSFYKKSGTAGTFTQYIVDGEKVSEKDYNKLTKGMKDKEKEKYDKDHGVKKFNKAVRVPKDTDDSWTKRDGLILSSSSGIGFRLPQQNFSYRYNDHGIRADGILLWPDDPNDKENNKKRTIEQIQKDNADREACKTPEMLAFLLLQHPEGIYIHAQIPNNKNPYSEDKAEKPHAVIISDYTVSKDGTYTFSVLDPAKNEKINKLVCTKASDIISPTHSLTISQIDRIYFLYEGKHNDQSATTLLKMKDEWEKSFK